MKKRNYTHIQVLLPEIKAMLAEGKTQREIAEDFGFKDKQVVKELLKCDRRKERKLEVGILPRPKKDAAPRNIVAEQAYEIQRLRMENKLLRDFLQSTERSFTKRSGTYPWQVYPKNMASHTRNVWQRSRRPRSLFRLLDTGPNSTTENPWSRRPFPAMGMQSLS